MKSSSSAPNATIKSTDASAPGLAVPPQRWVKVGAIAAASAVLGGLAAAWVYRKTLSRLREAGDGFQDFLPNITENETEEDF